MKILNATLPNVISILRLVLVIPYAWLFLSDANRRLIFAIALIIILSDKLDGWLARKWRSETKLGEWLDAFADGAFVLGSWVLFFIKGMYSKEILALLLFPRLFSMLIILFYRWRRRTWRTEHFLTNKIAGVANFFMILWLILELPYGLSLLLAMILINYICLFLTERERHKK